MAENLASGLESYKVQLSQVEAALEEDPGNDELVKLKQDLLEVIQLTVDLVGLEDTKEETTSTKSYSVKTKPSKWNKGDRCLAVKQDDGKYYQAVIEDILPESDSIVVHFPDLKVSDMCKISCLQPLPDDGGKIQPAAPNPKTKAIQKKEQMAQQREYRKQKNLKKKQRAKAKEAESEISKTKWQDFNKKTFSKTAKGRVKKSIFASPEGALGKVGVGTCGTAEKKMTKFDHGAKYNARHLIPK